VADDLNEFIRKNRAAWQEAERLLERAEAGGLEKLEEKEVRRLGDLYRALSGHLLMARTRFLDAETQDYLNDLVARGYAAIYQGRRQRLKTAWRFLSADFPRLFRARAGGVLASLSIFVAGALAGGWAGVADPDSVRFIVPPPYSTVSPDEYLKKKGSLSGAGESVLMMGHITTNNLRVAVFAFALGITFGVGTVAILFFNGLFMGSFSSIFIRAGRSYELFGLLAPHGLIEVLAILVAGAAGLALAKAVLVPGDRSRALALREDGVEALKLLLGTVPILLGAMVIESTLSKFQSVGPLPKYALGFAALAAVLAWLLLGGRRPAGLRASGAP
jgi:uncharacterized membrane protein SpoIIM required for sporulation